LRKESEHQLRLIALNYSMTQSPHSMTCITISPLASHISEVSLWIQPKPIMDSKNTESLENQRIFEFVAQKNVIEDTSFFIEKSNYLN